MAPLEYVQIPSYAKLIPNGSSPTDSFPISPTSQISTSLPHSRSSSESQPTSPQRSALDLIPKLLLSSAIPPSPTSADVSKGNLLSTRDPLSIPITTANFKRFVAKTGPLFWFQDRVEEVLMWKRGWKRTVTWMAAYSFFCYYPRMMLLVPHAIMIGIILATQPSESDDSETGVSSVPPTSPTEGSIAWQSNLQAIQNLMGAISDLHDSILPIVPHLSHASPYTNSLLVVLLLSSVVLIPITYIIPIRPVLLAIGLTPFILTHPWIHYHIIPSLPHLIPPSKPLRERLTRFIDDDNLIDAHWNGEMREVELWENERWSPEGKGWSKAWLKQGDRAPWTRARDGWTGVGGSGGDVSSNLTFSLSPGWAFVETEDWRADLQATWAGGIGGDDNGWVYTNDAWLDSQPTPLEQWGKGKTRRRRWVRRICHSDPQN